MQRRAAGAQPAAAAAPATRWILYPSPQEEARTYAAGEPVFVLLK